MSWSEFCTPCSNTCKVIGMHIVPKSACYPDCPYRNVWCPCYLTSVEFTAIQQSVCLSDSVAASRMKLWLMALVKSVLADTKLQNYHYDSGISLSNQIKLPAGVCQSTSLHSCPPALLLVCSDFPICYEGPHVISQQQVWVGVVTKGCDGVPLNSSYANR